MLLLSGGWQTTTADRQAAAEAVIAVVRQPSQPQRISLER